MKHFDQERYSELDKEQAIERLTEVTAEFENFAYIVSHDLQTPLRSIVNFSKLLKDKYYEKFDEKGNLHFSYIINGAEHMQNMVDGLLLYSRITTQGSEFSSVNIADIIGRVHIEYKKKIADAGAIISIADNLPEITCDAVQIEQLFKYLIDNALKFQPPGQQPEILIDVKLQDDKNYLFSVKDNGIGIEEGKHQDIFNIFRQLNKSSDHRGLGMGLAMAKKIIDRHKGKIWVESKPGKGSSFFFTLSTGKI